MTTLELILLGYLAASLLVAAALCFAATRLSPTPDSDDPDATVDDPDEYVRRIDRLPEVPPPAHLSGFALDARFFAVLAPSFREYR